VLRRHGFIDEDINTSGTVGWQRKGLGRGWEGVGKGQRIDWPAATPGTGTGTLSCLETFTNLSTQGVAVKRKKLKKEM